MADQQGDLFGQEVLKRQWQAPGCITLSPRARTGLQEPPGHRRPAEPLNYTPKSQQFRLALHLNPKYCFLTKWHYLFVIQGLQASPNLGDNFVTQEKVLWHDNFCKKDLKCISGISSGISTNMCDVPKPFFCLHFDISTIRRLVYITFKGLFSMTSSGTLSMASPDCRPEQSAPLVHDPAHIHPRKLTQWSLGTHLFPPSPVSTGEEAGLCLLLVWPEPKREVGTPSVSSNYLIN